MIRELRKQETRPGDSMTDEELSKYRSDLERFCGTGSKSSDKGPQRIPTVLSIRALDHALQAGCKLSFAFFFNAHPVRPLLAHERRFVVESAKLPASLCARGQKGRVSVLDEQTGRTRLELIIPAGLRHRLHCRSDRGSLGWTQWFPLFEITPLMGSFFHDEPHKFWDDDRGACAQAGLGVLLIGLLLCVNCGRCPWGSYSFQHQISDCAKTFFSQATVEDPYFLQWYEDLRTGFNDPHSFGSPASLDATLAHFRSCPLFDKPGADIKWARWYSIVDKLEGLLQWWWPYTAMVVLLCLKKGIFRDLAEVHATALKNYKTVSQKLNERASAGTKQDGDVDSAAGRGRMKDDDHANAKRATGVLQTVVGTMACRETFHLTSLIVYCLKPSRVEHGRSIVMQKTRRGSLQRTADMAGGAFVSWLNTLAGQLACPETLNTIGFSTPQTESATLSIEMETMMAHYMWQLQCRLLGTHVESALAYRWSFPMMAFVLVDQRPDLVAQGLAHLKSIWETWQEAESVAHTNAAVAEVCRNIVWMRWQWPRMVCLELLEARWEEVPEGLKEELWQTAQGPQTTKVTEDVLREPRAQESAALSAHISRLMRWHCMVHSNHLRDSDRPAPKSTSASKSLSKSVTLKPDFFAGDGGGPESSSLSPEFFAEVSRSDIQFRSPSSANYSLMPLYMMTLMKGRDAWDTLQHRWKSLLPSPGFVLQHKVDKSLGGLVLRASDAGVLLWSLKAAALPGVRAFELRSDDSKSNFQHVVIVDHSQWFAAETIGMPPALLRRLAQQTPGTSASAPPALPYKVLGRLEREPENLLRLSCRKGLRNLTVPLLRKLWRAEGVEGSCPSVVMELLKGLSSHILGAGADLDALVVNRETKDFIEVPTMLTPESVVMCADGIPAADFDEVLKVVQDAEAREKRLQGYRARSQQGVTSLGPPAGASSAASSSSGPPPPPEVAPSRFPLMGRSDYTVADVRPLLPEGFKVRLSREVRWHTRWRAALPDMPPPNTTSRSWGGKVTELMAIARVICDVYAIAGRNGGPECPFTDMAEVMATTA